ncbi:MAG: DUF3253 domain-containing protein [Actinomycetota bacterium]|nr:DUF3253 domain-containing protein [Actinomycetota bacterium]MDA3014650.1 DUF3253 domain-containing protein [Actinomycetota bacterium]MDA3028914.1 DUF3253 domain-containing protein [Actinomycetota bacterium]
MARHAKPSPDPRWCDGCGRSIEWRAKWARDWESIRWCSEGCRRRGVTDIDRRLETAIVDLLEARPHGATICPSEAARRVDEHDWRPLLEPARRAARRLVVAGRVVITQQGRVVDPSTARGPIRIRALR